MTNDNCLPPATATRLRLHYAGQAATAFRAKKRETFQPPLVVEIAGIEPATS